jgi:glycerol-3-phosphate acyltransferase PlsY
MASAATPPLLWLRGDSREAQLFVLLTVLLWLKHAANIRRLISGTEGKIGR